MESLIRNIIFELVEASHTVHKSSQKSDSLCNNSHVVLLPLEHFLYTYENRYGSIRVPSCASILLRKPGVDNQESSGMDGWMDRMFPPQTANTGGMKFFFDLHQPNRIVFKQSQHDFTRTKSPASGHGCNYISSSYLHNRMFLAVLHLHPTTLRLTDRKGIQADRKWASSA